MASLTTSRSWNLLQRGSTQVSICRWSSNVRKGRDTKRYSINYQTLKDGGFFGVAGASKAADLVSVSTPDTVAANVKNVTGFKGGAERGFLGIYPDCIHQIVSKGPAMLQEWTTKVLTQNLTTSTLGPTRYGLISPITFYQLTSSPNKAPEVAEMNKETMKEAHVLGWCVELLRSSQIMTLETLQFRGHRNILSQIRVEPGDTWAQKHDLGNRAFNDALLLQNGALTLMHVNLVDHPSYGNILDTAGEAMAIMGTGRAMNLRIDGLPTQGAKMKALNASTYKTIIHSNLSHTRYVLPVRLALFLAGLKGKRVHEQARKVLHDIGFLAEMTGDFADCYFGEQGTDIQDGRLTWLLVNAYHRANPQQKAALEENYGVDDPAQIAIVKQVYDDLKLKKMVGKDIDQHREEMMNNIYHISALSKETLSSRFFFQLLDHLDHIAQAK